MTVDVARRPRRRAAPKAATPEPPVSSAPSSLAIGEIDQTIFECPSCSRPLALGAHRCPGCRTRLVRGVTLGKASGFVAVGLAVGLLVGGGAGVAFGLGSTGSSRAGSTPITPGGPVAGANGGTPSGSAPTSTPIATAVPRLTPAPTDPNGVPPLVRSALVQVVGTNARLSTAGADLRTTLSAQPFDASAVAQILRTISAESLFSEQVAQHVGEWTGSATLGSRLGAYYGSVHSAAADGLVASVRNDAAYRAAATTMLKLLDGITTLDDAVRSTAATAGVDLSSTAP